MQRMDFTSGHEMKIRSNGTEKDTFRRLSFYDKSYSQKNAPIRHSALFGHFGPWKPQNQPDTSLSPIQNHFLMVIKAFLIILGISESVCCMGVFLLSDPGPSRCSQPSYDFGTLAWFFGKSTKKHPKASENCFKHFTRVQKRPQSRF